MSIEEQLQAAKNEFGDDAHKRFCIKGFCIDRLADTQKRKNTFEHSSLNDFAEWLLNDCINSGKKYAGSTVYDENGCFLPSYYPHPYYFHLKPLPDLYAHDDSYYIDAFLMWQWRYADHSNDWTDCNKPLSFKTDKEYQRKTSAALPFDLERARAGDVTEALTGDGEWWNVEIMGVTANKIFVKWFDNSGDFFNHKEAKKRLRMKYPQKERWKMTSNARTAATSKPRWQ